MSNTTALSSYEQQAQDFLKATNSIITSAFSRKDKYFGDDKEARDIYDVTIVRGEKEYTFTFGQSLTNSEHWSIVSNNTLTTIRLDNNLFTEIEQAKSKVKDIAAKIRKDRVKDIQIEHHERKTPTAYDILTCLEKYDPYTFEDFCSNYDYDTDSRKAMKIYQGCVDQYRNLSEIFTPEELEQMQEIQ